MSDLSPNRGVIDLGNSPAGPVSLYPNALVSTTRKPICLKLTSPFNASPSVCTGASEPVCPEFNAWYTFAPKYL